MIGIRLYLANSSNEKASDESKKYDEKAMLIPSNSDTEVQD